MRRPSVLALPLLLMAAAGAALSSGAVAIADGGLRPADEVNAERAWKQATTGKFGKVYDVGGLRLIVSAIEPGADPDRDEPTVVVSVRTENRTSKRLSNPDAGVFCRKVLDGGPWFAESTWRVGEELPRRTFVEGTVVLGFPDAVPISDCRSAVVRFSEVGVIIGKPDSLQFPIPSDVIAAARTAAD